MKPVPSDLSYACMRARACVRCMIRRVILMRTRLSGLASMPVPHLCMHATPPFLALD